MTDKPRRPNGVGRPPTTSSWKPGQSGNPAGRKRTKILGPKQRVRLSSQSQTDDKRDKMLRKKYGITLDEWKAILKSQGDSCGMCGASDPAHRYGWHTDHCHQTGRVRGILCSRCNPLLGMLGDNVESAAKLYCLADGYLRRAAGT